MIAFVLGNGRSRQCIDVKNLQKTAAVYACNAIYRECTPDVLVSTDRPISETIQNSGYAQCNRFYTRKPLENSGALRLPRQYQGFSSGPNAVGLACIDGHAKIYMLGFDLGSTDQHFNNVYADTQFYKKKTDPPTYSGNWIRQITQITKDYPNVEFVRVTGVESAVITELSNLPNMQSLTVQQFQTLLNTPKGLL
jgi:hypothetical protein